MPKRLTRKNLTKQKPVEVKRPQISKRESTRTLTLKDKKMSLTKNASQELSNQRPVEANQKLTKMPQLPQSTKNQASGGIMLRRKDSNKGS